MPMRVLVNTKPLLNRKTGIAYCIENTINQLSDRGVDLVFSHSLEGAELSSKIKEVSDVLKNFMGGYYPFGPAAVIYNFLMKSYLKDSSRICKNKYCDIYHEMTHVLIPDVFSNFQIKRFIADIHDVSPMVYPQYHLSSLVESVGRTINDLLSADIFIVKTNYIRSEVSEIFNLSKSKIKVVPNAPSYPYKFLEQDKESLRKVLSSKVGISIEKPFILYTGTVEPRKNIDSLIRAFAKFRYNDDFLLVIAGGLGWKYQNTVDLPKQLNIDEKVYFLGYQPEEIFELLYNSAQFFVFPSFYEGFGMPSIEAMQCGLPVISSNASCLPEVVGEAALLFDPLDIDNLIAQMTLLVESTELAEDLSQKGLAQAQFYSWDQIGNQILNIYNEVVS